MDIPATIPEVVLNDKQRLFKDKVHDYVTKWQDAKHHGGIWPKPLRLFLMGAPGTGKSTATKATMSTLKDILGQDWTDIVRQATPTGCASFQMSADATTVHQLLGLSLAPQRDLTPAEVAKLVAKFSKGLCLLVIDEFSMVSRVMMGIVLERLRFAKIDLDRIGIIMIGDPAQLLPIGGEPCWSTKLTRLDGQKFHTNSYFGMDEIRTVFRMTKLENIPNYNVYRFIEKLRKPTETQRRQYAEFIATAMEGDYDAVYLTEVRRTIDGDELSDELVKNLIPRCRYGRTTKEDLIRFKEIFASENEVANDEKFNNAKVIEGYHYFAMDEPSRKNVESENIRRTFEFAQKNKEAVVWLKAAHMPIKDAPDLAQVSGKQFEGVLSHFVACKKMPIMILTNLAPQFGLFNGATCSFEGLLYLQDEAELQITKKDFQTLHLSEKLSLEKPFDLASRGFGYSQFHQLPISSILVAIDGKSVLSLADVTAAIAELTQLNCQFRLPKQPPALPDFVVVRSDAYQRRGGPNFLGIEGLSENLFPIPCIKVPRKLPTGKTKTSKPQGKQNKKASAYRIGFKTECAIVVTPYKQQGRTEERMQTEIKDHASVPGLWNVSVSRCKSPKHNYIPDGQWPNYMDIQLQRLNPFVAEAEIFERAIKIQASKTLRKWTVESGKEYGISWTKEESDAADSIGIAYKEKCRTSIPAIQKVICDRTYKTLDSTLIKEVVSKMDSTHESLLKEDPPYLKDSHYQSLLDYQKPPKAARKVPRKQMANKK